MSEPIIELLNNIILYYKTDKTNIIELKSIYNKIVEIINNVNNHHLYINNKEYIISINDQKNILSIELSLFTNRKFLNDEKNINDISNLLSLILLLFDKIETSSFSMNKNLNTDIQEFMVKYKYEILLYHYMNLCSIMSERINIDNKDNLLSLRIEIPILIIDEIYIISEKNVRVEMFTVYLNNPNNYTLYNEMEYDEFMNLLKSIFLDGFFNINK